MRFAALPVVGRRQHGPAQVVEEITGLGFGAVALIVIAGASVVWARLTSKHTLLRQTVRG